ncbi:MAG: hypothetical protein R2911_35340 [Caldilineaceae bacterium]
MLTDRFCAIAPVLRTVNLAGEQQDFSPHLPRIGVSSPLLRGRLMAAM